MKRYDYHLGVSRTDACSDVKDALKSNPSLSGEGIFVDERNGELYGVEGPEEALERLFQHLAYGPGCFRERVSV